MKAFLSDGNTREISVQGAMTGLQFDSVALDVGDLRKLLGMKDSELRDFLSHLSTRFAPKK